MKTAAELLGRFDDIHTHGRTGPGMITSVEPGEDMVGLPGAAWYSVGIHPWSTATEPGDDVFRQLEAALRDERVVAVGECGLDALRGGSAACQEAVFRRQAELAERAGLPVIIHCVRRFGRLMELRRELRPEQPWIIHGFRGKRELARQLLAAGFDLSAGPGAPPWLEEAVPPGRLFRESDTAAPS